MTINRIVKQIIILVFLLQLSGCSLIRYYGFTIDHNSTNRTYNIYSLRGHLHHKRNTKETQFITSLYRDEFVSFSFTHLSCRGNYSEIRIIGNYLDKPVNLEILKLEIDVYNKGKKVHLKKIDDNNPKHVWDRRIHTFRNYYKINPFINTLEQKITIRFVLNGEEHLIEDSFIINKNFQYNAKEEIGNIFDNLMSI